MKLPAMYLAADYASRRSQWLHFVSFLAEYLALICVALVNQLFIGTPVHSTYLIVSLIFFAVIAVGRRAMEYEKKWYQSRALAESIKTTSWRYSMKAIPFDTPETDLQATKIFRGYLAGILKANRHLGSVISANDVGVSQVTEEMRSTRQLSTADRLQKYGSERVDNQQAWYSTKSNRNKRHRTYWWCAIAFIFITLILAASGKFAAPEFIVRLFDPILVLCTASIGWVEVKRYGELAASYSMTSHEIGIIRGEIEIVNDEKSLSDYVNEAERAFSREHTQWLARSQIET